MLSEHNFLITYGLHNFVRCAKVGANPAFVIQGKECPKMIRHAKALITGNYGPATEIREV